jgi:hypothetical protein
MFYALNKKYFRAIALLLDESCHTVEVFTIEFAEVSDNGLVEDITSQGSIVALETMGLRNVLQVEIFVTILHFLIFLFQNTLFILHAHFILRIRLCIFWWTSLDSDHTIVM